MKRILLLLLIINICFSSCNNKADNVSSCLDKNEISHINPLQVDSTIHCIESYGVVPSLKQEETTSLIAEMEVNHPQESRKLWMLCSNIDNGVIEYPKNNEVIDNLNSIDPTEPLMVSNYPIEIDSLIQSELKKEIESFEIIEVDVFHSIIISSKTIRDRDTITTNKSQFDFNHYDVMVKIQKENEVETLYCKMTKNFDIIIPFFFDK